MADQEPNFARPWAPHRRRIYLGAAAFTGAAFVLVVVGVGVGDSAPDVHRRRRRESALRRPGDPASFVLLWDAPGENRTRLDKASELTLFYLPYTAGSQIGYELVFLIGHPLNLWTPTDDPGWKWLWWQYGLADTRYTSGNNWIFGLELVGVDRSA